MHLQGHIDSEKQQTLDLSDLTQCRHCYKQFDTPFEMQTHIEKVCQLSFTCPVVEGKYGVDAGVIITIIIKSKHFDFAMFLLKNEKEKICCCIKCFL